MVQKRSVPPNPFFMQDKQIRMSMLYEQWSIPIIVLNIRPKIFRSNNNHFESAHWPEFQVADIRYTYAYTINGQENSEAGLCWLLHFNDKKWAIDKTMQLASIRSISFHIFHRPGCRILGFKSKTLKTSNKKEHRKTHKRSHQNRSSFWDNSHINHMGNCITSIFLQQKMKMIIISVNWSIKLTDTDDFLLLHYSNKLKKINKDILRTSTETWSWILAPRRC